MSAHAVLAVLVAGLVLALVISRQLKGFSVSRRSLLVMPGVLLTFGLFLLSLALDQASLAQLAFLALECAALLGFGLARGASLRLTTKPEGLWLKGTGTTLVLWLLTIGIKVAGVLVFESLWPHNPLRQALLVLTIGITIAAETALVLHRAQKLPIPTPA